MWKHGYELRKAPVSSRSFSFSIRHKRIWPVRTFCCPFIYVPHILSMRGHTVKRFIMVAYQVDPLDNSFTQVLNRILFDTTLSMGARLTYAALVEHYRDNDKCWPTQERLASMVGCKSDRTIRVYLDELITRGLVTVIKRGCWKRANEYRLHALVPPKTASESQPDMRTRPALDTRNRTYHQLYQTNNSINNRANRRLNQGQRTGEAGAVAMFRRMGLT